jgi:hypothetical protein
MRFHFAIKSWQLKLIERGWRSDPASLAVIAAYVGTAAVGYGVYEGISTMTSGDKQKKSQQDLLGAAPAAPSQDDANAKAEETLTQNRRQLLAGGGNTDITGGSPILSGNTQSNSLIGG